MSMLAVPATPRDLGLPFDKWRKYQREAVQDIIDLFDEYRVVLLGAPTGSGKTVIGSALGRVLSGSALFLSHTIRLQEQQLQTLPEARTATGRGNHPCVLRDPLTDQLVDGLTAAEAPCKCEYVLECPYFCQFLDCAETPEAVLNYAYATRILRARYIKVDPDEEGFPNPFRGRDVMVCDEGHLLERALVDAEGVQVSRRAFKQIGIDIPDSRDIQHWVPWGAAHVDEVNEELTSARQALRASPSNRTLRTEVRRLRSASEVLTKLAEIDVQDVPWFVGRTEHGYQVRPLWVWDQATPVLFRHSPHVLIMSATLGNPVLLARLLGLKPGEWTHLEVPSTFPVPNRPVYYWPVAKMRHGMPDSEKVRQAQALDRLAALFPSTPGVVHCNSFALGEFLEAKASPETRKRVLLHSRYDRGAVSVFEQQPGNRILVSPSVTVGVDWDFVGWSMIPKVPYPDLGDDIVRLRFEYVTEEGEPIGKQVYQQEAAVTVVQAAGRHVRTERSKGVTVITDRAFWPLFKYQAPAAFPQWFRDAVVWQEM